MQIFSQELSPEAVMVGAEAYDLEEFGRLIGGLSTCVAMDGEKPIGFCTVRGVDTTTAEILFLYVQLDHAKRGVGSGLVRHGESWIRKEYPDVSKLILDTVVPRYNRMFWERMGYSVVGERVLTYPTGEIPAVRLSKIIDPIQRQEIGKPHSSF